MTLFLLILTVKLGSEKYNWKIRGCNLAVLKFNLGNLDIKETDRVIITVICLQNVKNVLKNDVVIQKSRQVLLLYTD